MNYIKKILNKLSRIIIVITSNKISLKKNKFFNTFLFDIMVMLFSINVILLSYLNHIVFIEKCFNHFIYKFNNFNYFFFNFIFFCNIF